MRQRVLLLPHVEVHDDPEGGLVLDFGIREQPPTPFGEPSVIFLKLVVES